MTSSPSSTDPARPGPPEDTLLCRISCESASVAVLLHPTGNGRRLHLVSERTGARALLDATVLDALCTLTPAAATALVRAAVQGPEQHSPYAPHDQHAAQDPRREDPPA